MKIDLCICTFRRPHITETLASIAEDPCPQGVSRRVIVVDNDDSPTARRLVDEALSKCPFDIQYIHAPGANISIARNAALDAASADWVAFLDDDEVVDPGWLAALLACQTETRADAVFGPSLAAYGPDAPAWIVEGDFHSQHPTRRGDVVETGHTCNALLRWRGAPWQGERFDLARGRSGGEDTEFFFRLHRMGAVYAICEAAIVREEVPAARLSLTWLLRRRFRIGQSYSASAVGGLAKLRLFALAGAKAAYCFFRALIAGGQQTRRNFWLMRGTMHSGVCAGCLALRQRALYGHETT